MPSTWSLRLPEPSLVFRWGCIWSSLRKLTEGNGTHRCMLNRAITPNFSGTFVQVGMGAPNINIPMYLVAGKELTMHGSFRYVRVW